MQARYHSVVALLLSLVGLGACSPSADLLGTGAIDPAGGLTREDYLALRDRRPAGDGGAEALVPPIPALPDGDVREGQLNPQMNKLVSVTVTDSVPVRDVLMELVRKTGANLQLDPRVQGNVIITAHDQPLEQVLKRICKMAKLRYMVEGAFIHIVPDEPYQKTYRLDYLSLARNATSTTSIATNVFDVDVSTNASSGSTSQNGSTATQNNSTSRVMGVSEADFWAETEKSVAQILNANGKNNANAKANYSVDRQAGIVTIYGDQTQQDAIENYFTELRAKAYAQVLIDARIIEVELDDGYQSGIDWAGMFRVFGKRFITATNFGTDPDIGTNGYFTAGIAGSNFAGIINLVQTFGSTRVLSAPRLTVLNNQTAVMKVATNQVYFVTQAQFTTTTNASGASITTNPVYTSTPRTVPVGLVMTVQPAIDTKNSRVTMTLRPTISRIVGEVSDPSISLNAAVAGVVSPVKSQIPVLAVREMDSVIQLHSGEIAVLGGLMQDSSINTDQGVPGLADVDWIGNLFKQRDNKGKTSELVILLRATIADQPVPDRADGDLYDFYNRDPRPMNVPRNPRVMSEDAEDTAHPEEENTHEEVEE